jgi:hypothetical protein
VQKADIAGANDFPADVQHLSKQAVAMRFSLCKKRTGVDKSDLEGFMFSQFQLRE